VPAPAAAGAVTRQAAKTAPRPPIRTEPDEAFAPVQLLDEAGSVDEEFAPAQLLDEGDESVDTELDQFDLFQHPRYLVKKKRSVLSNLINVHFDIIDPDTKETFGVADENPGTLVQALRWVGKLRLFLPTRVEVREREKGPVVFAIRLGVTLFPLPTKVAMYDAAGDLIGYFRSKIFSFFGGFWLFDAEGQEVAEVKFKFGMPPRMNFVSADGHELGYVTTEGLAALAEKRKKGAVVTGTPGLEVVVGSTVQGQPRVKLLLMATVLAMEFTGIGKKFIGNDSGRAGGNLSGGIGLGVV
jgi:hypothetical protein